MNINYYKTIAIRMLFQKGYDGCRFGEDEFGKYFMYRYPGYDTNNLYYEKDILLDEWEEMFGMFWVNNFKSGGTIILFDDKFYDIGDVRYYKSDIVKRSPGARGTIVGSEMFFYTKDEDYRDIKHTVKTVVDLKRFLKKVNAKEVIL